MMKKGLLLVFSIPAFTVLSAPAHHQYKLEFYDDIGMTTSRQLKEHLNDQNVPFTSRILSRNEFDQGLHVGYEIEFKDRKSAEEELPKSMELVTVKSSRKNSPGRTLVLTSANDKFVFMKARDRLYEELCSKTRSSIQDQKDCDRSIENIVELLYIKSSTRLKHELRKRCKDFKHMPNNLCVAKLNKLRRKTTV